MSVARTRLCIVCPAHWSAFMGGSQYQIKCLLSALAPLNRYEIYYLARRVAPDFVSREYQIIRIGKRNKPLGLGYLMDAVPLYSALRRIKPHVIYQRVGCGYTGISALYARRNGARLIWHVANDSDVKPESLFENINPLRNRLEKRSIEYGIKHSRHIVVQTEHQATLLRRHYGRAVDAVVPNFHPEATELIDKAGPVTVVWVANLKPWKQPEVFVRLAAKLRDLHEVRFVMIGAPASGQPWNDALMQAIRSTPNLEYLGQRTQEEVNAVLARAHLFVNTSLFEGFANTFIQAWMRETPVVSLHVNPDGVFDEGTVGVCAGTEERLVESVRTLVTDHSRRSRLGVAARGHAMRRHSFQNARLLASLIDTGEVTSETDFNPDVLSSKDLCKD